MLSLVNSAVNCPHLLLNAVLRRRCCWPPAPATVDRCVLPVGRSAANPPHAATAVNRRDRQTNGETDGQTHSPLLHRLCCAYCAVNAISHNHNSNNHWMQCRAQR